MRTIRRRTLRDGLKVKLVEREIKPRFVVITGGETMAGFHPVGNDKDHAIRVFDRHVEHANATAA